jgi:transcriptional regulator with XRE-family HTH domain
MRAELAKVKRQQDLADKLGISQAQVSELAARKGVGETKASVVAAIASKLQKNGHWLLTGDDRTYVLADRTAAADWERGYADGFKAAQEALQAALIAGSIGVPIAPILAPEPTAGRPAASVERFAKGRKRKRKKKGSA